MNLDILFEYYLCEENVCTLLSCIGGSVVKFSPAMREARVSLTKLRGREGGAGAERAILPHVGHLQLISTLKIGAVCCHLCQYKLT